MDAASDQMINITPMTAEEAREWVDAIKSHLESLRGMLLELHRRQGWVALGYTSWRACAIAEFQQSQGYVYKLLHAAEVEENLAAATFIQLDKSTIPISQLEELHKLPPEQQALGLQKADELAASENKPRTIKHISRVVKELKPSKAPRSSWASSSQDHPKLKEQTSGEREIAEPPQMLGLPSAPVQVSPSVERNHNSSADVDERPKATSPSPVEINTNDICIGLISNVPYLTDDQIIACYKAITRRIPLEALGLGHWSDVELKRMIEAGQRELKRRHRPD